MTVTESVLKYCTVNDNSEGNVSVIIVCGGSSQRMGGIDKMFVQVNGIPVCVRSALKFQQHEAVQNIVIVTKADNILKMQQMCEKYGLKKVTDIVEGGSCRQESVYNGLKMLSNETDIVLIHDGARPFVTEKCITDVIEGARVHSAVTCAVKLKDTVKTVNEDSMVVATPDRSSMVSVQTPQGFQLKLYREAVENKVDCLEQFTDDCSIVESYGFPVYTVEGDYRNIKITTAEDLKIAEIFAEDL